MAVLTWEKFFDNMLKAMDRAHKRAEKFSQRTATLADDLENLGHNAEVSGKHINKTRGTIQQLGKAITGLDMIANSLYKKTVDWQTAARLAVRGTTLMDASLSKVRESYLKAEKNGLVYAKTAGVGADEALQMAVSVENSIRKVSERVKGGMGDTQQYLEDTANMAIYMGMSTQDAMKMSQMAVEQMGMSLTKSTKMMGGAAAAADSFGLQAGSAMEVLSANMERIQGLDEADRERFVRKLMYSAGVQEKAAVNFGKYTASLTESKGTDALKRASFLGATSGASPGALLKAMNSPHDAESQKVLMDAIAKSAEKLSPGFTKLDQQMKANPGSLTEAQAVQHAVEQQKLIQTLGQYAGVTPDQVSQLNEARRRRDSNKVTFGDFNNRADRLGRKGGTGEAAQGITTQGERDKVYEAQRAKVLGVGTEVQDKALDVYGNFERYVKRLGGEFLELIGAAQMLTKAFMLSGGSSLLGSAGNLLGGGASKIGSLLTGPLGKIGAKIGVAGLAIEAGMAVYKVSTEEGRKQMQLEIEEGAAQADTLGGTLSNFGKALTSPTESVLKVGMMYKNALDYWDEIQKDQIKAMAHKAQLEKLHAESQKKAMETESGRALMASRQKAQQVLDIYAHDSSGKKNYHNKAQLSAALAEGKMQNRSEEQVIADVADRNRRYQEALRIGDTVTQATIQTELKRLQDLRNDVYFDGKAFGPQRVTPEKQRGNEPIPVKMSPNFLESKLQASEDTAARAEMQEMIAVLKENRDLNREILATKDKPGSLAA